MMEKPRPYTLPRSAILRGKGAFSEVFADGKGFRRGQIVIKYRLRQGERELRTGFVVRRGTGSAVKRNRLRRLLREAYRLARLRFEDTLPDGVALDLVILWSGTPEQALRPRLEEIRGDIDASLRKLSRILVEHGNATGQQ
jgi:ribonuclease P protein component